MMCYFDYEVKLNEITDNQQHKFKLEEKENTQMYLIILRKMNRKFKYSTKRYG